MTPIINNFDDFRWFAVDFSQYPPRSYLLYILKHLVIHGIYVLVLLASLILVDVCLFSFFVETIAVLVIKVIPVITILTATKIVVTVLAATVLVVPAIVILAGPILIRCRTVIVLGIAVLIVCICLIATVFVCCFGRDDFGCCCFFVVHSLIDCLDDFGYFFVHQVYCSLVSYWLVYFVLFVAFGCLLLLIEYLRYFLLRMLDEALFLLGTNCAHMVFNIHT